jgi:hypothetical protein
LIFPREYWHVAWAQSQAEVPGCEWVVGDLDAVGGLAPNGYGDGWGHIILRQTDAGVVVSYDMAEIAGFPDYRTWGNVPAHLVYDVIPRGVLMLMIVALVLCRSWRVWVACEPERG